MAKSVSSMRRNFPVFAQKITLYVKAAEVVFLLAQVTAPGSLDLAPLAPLQAMGVYRPLMIPTFRVIIRIEVIAMLGRESESETKELSGIVNVNLGIARGIEW